MNAGTGPPEAAQRRRQKAAPQGAPHEADGQPARLSPGDARGIPLHPLGVVEQGARLAGEPSSRLGEPHPPSFPIEELQPQRSSS